jgi:FkbM family methyltransferase
MIKHLLKSLYINLPWKQEVFSIIKKVYKPPRSLYQHLYFNGIFQVKVGKEHFYLKHYGYQIENSIFWEGIESWEKISTSLWIQLCKKADIILDIGANTGIYSLVACSVNTQARVYAFEPVSRVFDKLVENVQLNKFNVVSYEAAVSNFDGRAVIYDQPTEHILSVTVNKNTQDPSIPVIEKEIRTVTLASFIEENKIPKIDLMKIDVETHEPEVLEGMKAYLGEHMPTLLIEILEDEIGRKVEAILKGLGYLYFDIDEVNRPRQVNRLVRSSYYNYLICDHETAHYLNLL